MRVLSILLIGLCFAGCDFFGQKQDDITDEIFDQGRIDPTAVDEVGYVPVQPFFQDGFGGAFSAPQDVYVGYDGFVYVVDARGLHLLDRAGRPQRLVADVAGQPLREPTSVIQDRRFHVYVTALRDTTVEGTPRRLPVIYRLSGLVTGTVRVEDVIWHPFDDRARQVVLRNPIPEDEQVRFTGVAVLPDNAIYATRSGPLGVSLRAPYNAVMQFSPAGVNVNTLTQLSGTRPSLVSAVYPSAVLTRVQPPQRATFTASRDFFVAQSPTPPAGGEAPVAAPYGVLSIRAEETPDGILYRPDVTLLAAAQTAARSLYTPGRFADPSGLAYAADGTGYLFVVDRAKDSLFVFNASGVEGVAPPPGARNPLPVNVSFGGMGSGLLQFNRPQGVAYAGRTLYVADTGNNRIARYRLNTDLE